ncbi:MAG TPA: 3'-5' exonuclease [Polyangiaceae bacterium]|nr:3'-5' exonuclease [Polyangiaceae bacterium]
MKVISDGCGCFPSGRHYPGIAHLLRVTVRGLVEELGADTPWLDVPIAMLDVETTGRDSGQDRVIELGIVVGRAGEVVVKYNWMINPGRAIAPDAQEVHGISDADVANAPPFEAIAHEVRRALEGCVPAAYNAPFDRAFLHAEFARVAAGAAAGGDGGVGGVGPLAPALRREVEWLDPLVWARELQSDQRSRTLVDVAARLGVKLENAHRASDDAEAALHVLYRLGRDARVPHVYGAFLQEQRRLSLMQADERRMWRSP